jgi:proteasome accessory factor B
MSNKSDADFALGKPERLFNLTCTLLYAREGLTKKEILQTVQGYADEYKTSGNNDTLDKKFERDKNDLRDNGIRIDVTIPAHEDENNQATRYKITRESFSWPMGLKLTPKQLSLLNLAAQAWAGGSLSSEASRGITKLRALGVIGNSSDITGISPRILAFEPAFKNLDFAIAECQVVNFDYRNPTTGEISNRTFQPWVMRQIAGQWLVLGFDEQRGEPRNFMLRRIVSSVTQSKSGKDYLFFETPDQDAIDDGVKALDEHAKSQVAVLKIRRGSEAWFRYELDLSQNSDNDSYRINYFDIHVLAEQLRQYSDQVEVLEPLTLGELVRAGFRKVADLHG